MVHMSDAPLNGKSLLLQQLTQHIGRFTDIESGLCKLPYSVAAVVNLLLLGVNEFPDSVFFLHT